MARVYFPVPDKEYLRCPCGNPIAYHEDLTCNYRHRDPVSRGWFTNAHNVRYVPDLEVDDYIRDVHCGDCGVLLGVRLTIKTTAVHRLLLEEMGSFVLNMRALIFVVPDPLLGGETPAQSLLPLCYADWEVDAFRVSLNELILIYMRFRSVMEDILGFFLD